jgi:hypothetical protein
VATALSNPLNFLKLLFAGGQSKVNTVKSLVVSDNEVPTRRKAIISGMGDPTYLSRSDLTAEKVQAAIEQGERGQTRQLFQLFRDSIASYAHIQTELGKRKMAVLSKIQTIAPFKEEGEKEASAEAVSAAKCIRAMIADCGDEWERGLSFLMDSCLYPVMVCEKLFDTPKPGDEAYRLGLRYTLKKLQKVDPFLYCFQLPYMATNTGATTSASWDPEAWEPDLAFYCTFESGMINCNAFDSYAPERELHLVYRGNFLTSQRDNWGGPMRALLLWWFCATKGRDWWNRFMERFGVPFVVVKADMQDVTTAGVRFRICGRS